MTRTSDLMIDLTRCRGRGACIDFLNHSLTEDMDGYPVPVNGSANGSVHGSVNDTVNGSGNGLGNSLANGSLRKGFRVAPSDLAMVQQAVDNCPLRALNFRHE